MSPSEEHPLRLGNAIFNCLLRILGEVVVSHDQLMQLISEEIGTSCASMAVINSEEGASWPVFNLLELRLDNIQNNRDSIFVIIPDNTLMCICSITANNTVLLASEFRWMVRRNITIYLLLFHPHVFRLLLDSHDKSSVRGQLILALRLLHRTLVLLLPILIVLRLFIQIFVRLTSWWLGFASSRSTSRGLSVVR